MKFLFLLTVVLAVLIAANPLQSAKGAEDNKCKEVCRSTGNCIKNEKPIEKEGSLLFQITPFAI